VRACDAAWVTAGAVVQVSREEKLAILGFMVLVLGLEVVLDMWLCREAHCLFSPRLIICAGGLRFATELVFSAASAGCRSVLGRPGSDDHHLRPQVMSVIKTIFFICRRSDSRVRISQQSNLCCLRLQLPEAPCVRSILPTTDGLWVQPDSKLS
jgi:hypothetical protein